MIKQDTIAIETFDKELEGLQVELSFEPFLRYLSERVKTESPSKAAQLNRLIESLEKALRLKGELSVESYSDFEKEFEFIKEFLVPPIANEEEVLLGFGIPVKRQCFYGTAALFSIMQGGLCTTDLTEESLNKDRDIRRVPYLTLLKKYYGFKFTKKQSFVRSLLDPKTGLNRYYEITVDDQFIEVENLGSKLDLSQVKINQLSDSLNYEHLEALIPLSNFKFKGFSIISVSDITSVYAIERIKELIIGSKVSFQDERLIKSLKTIIGDKDVEFELIPYLKLNDKPVLNLSEERYESPILEMFRRRKISMDTLGESIEKIAKNRMRVLVNTGILSTGQEFDFITRGLQALQVHSYALTPIYHHSKLVGVFEMYTKKKNHFLDENVLPKLDGVSPLLAQILENATVDFELQIDQIIKNKFTSLQPAVQWKFNEIALEYLQSIESNKPAPSLGTISFEDVYPLYGAIDIKNSTLERNSAFATDTEFQLEYLKTVLQKLSEKLGIGILEEMIFTCNKLIERLKLESMDRIQTRVMDFLEREVNDVLAHFKKQSPEAFKLISKYEAAVDPHKGKAFANRRELEHSIQLINSSINQYLELFNVEIQNSYPSYFEKFRTDGVEYDIYIGQSIAPQKPFNPLYLKNIRLWQLTSMAAIAGITKNLMPQMKVPLETTQLIFVNGNTIDISFRTDERRFDVEGSYNIRYEIIKKRIDKITLKNSLERLTQPGKISFVFIGSKEMEEYKGYIHFLQNKGLLLDDLEVLELEELHDVNGLKGLRVGVNYEQMTSFNLSL